MDRVEGAEQNDEELRLALTKAQLGKRSRRDDEDDKGGNAKDPGTRVALPAEEATLHFERCWRGRTRRRSCTRKTEHRHVLVETWEAYKYGASQETQPRPQRLQLRATIPSGILFTLLELIRVSLAKA